MVESEDDIRLVAIAHQDNNRGGLVVPQGDEALDAVQRYHHQNADDATLLDGVREGRQMERDQDQGHGAAQGDAEPREDASYCVGLDPRLQQEQNEEEAEDEG